MATRLHRNATIIDSIGLQYCHEIGNGGLRAEDTTMVHPYHQDFPATWEDFQKLVISTADTNKCSIKCVLMRDITMQRSILIQNADDYQLLCQTERKQYNRMPVFTIIVTPKVEVVTKKN